MSLEVELALSSIWNLRLHHHHWDHRIIKVQIQIASWQTFWDCIIMKMQVQVVSPWTCRFRYITIKKIELAQIRVAFLGIAWQSVCFQFLCVDWRCFALLYILLPCFESLWCRCFGLRLIDLYFLCFALLCLALLGCGAEPCGAVSCNAVRCDAVWCGAMRCGALCLSMCLCISFVLFKYFSSRGSQPHPQSRYRCDSYDATHSSSGCSWLTFSKTFRADVAIILVVFARSARNDVRARSLMAVSVFTRLICEQWSNIWWLVSGFVLFDVFTKCSCCHRGPSWLSRALCLQSSSQTHVYVLSVALCLICNSRIVRSRFQTQRAGTSGLKYCF